MSAPVIPLFPNGCAGPLPSGEKAPCRKDATTLNIIIGGGVNGRGGEGPLGAEDVLEVWRGHACLGRLIGGRGAGARPRVSGAAPGADVMNARRGAGCLYQQRYRARRPARGAAGVKGEEL
jgi:hypothetical protein